MMKHLLQITADGRLQPHWRPGTPWREIRRLARAFRAFVEGIDPHDHAPGFYRFDVDTDGNAMVGGRARPRPGMLPNPLMDALLAELQRPLATDPLLPPEDRS